MKKKVLPLLFAALLVLGACTSNQSVTSSIKEEISSSDSFSDDSSFSSDFSSGSSSQSIPDDFDYIDTNVNIFRETNKVDKTMTVRFYKEMPHVPYVTASSFFKEFFNTRLTVTVSGSEHKYSKGSSAYFGFDAKLGTFFAYELADFNSHPDFIDVVGRTYVFMQDYEQSDIVLKTINLKDYFIPIYEEGNEIYAPLTFYSQLAGGYSLYNIAYNGKDIYVIDYDAELSDVSRTPSYYYDTYYEVLSNMKTSRPIDLANYVYNELCLVFDNFRGDTLQLIFGDEKLQTKGLNWIIENEYPELKRYLLSPDKEKYYAGINALFAGLYDGGHTSSLAGFAAYDDAVSNDNTASFQPLLDEKTERTTKKTYVKSSITFTKYMLGFNGDHYYNYDADSKTAYIGFRNFNYDGAAWDKFYKGIGTIPVLTDAYAYVRSKFYQAKEDGALNVVLDIADNGGGSTYAYAGIVGLCNGAESSFTLKDTFNEIKMDEYYGIDIDLDGRFTQDDIDEANKFDFNIGVLTSNYSFSCANLFPNAMKELGFKIIGQRSGGGSCAINIKTTGDGIMYVHSAYYCITDKNGGNIDGGVEPDLEIQVSPRTDIPTMDDYAPFYDFATIGNYLSTAYTDGD